MNTFAKEVIKHIADHKIKCAIIQINNFGTLYNIELPEGYNHEKLTEFYFILDNIEYHNKKLKLGKIWYKCGAYSAWIRKEPYAVEYAWKFIPKPKIKIPIPKTLKQNITV